MSSVIPWRAAIRVVAVERPGHGLADRPPAGAVAVEPQVGGNAVEAVEHVALALAELGRADDRGDRELPLADQRLWVYDKPGLALRREDIVAVQVLVKQHLLTL